MNYQDLAFLQESVRVLHMVPLNEVYSGESLVRWHGSIERQLQSMLTLYERAKNHSYTDKLRAMLTVWRRYPLTGSINTEDVQALESAVEVLAVDSWQLNNYFSNLRDSLRSITASEEELPRMPDAPELSRKPSAKNLGAEVPSQFGSDVDSLAAPSNDHLPPAA